MHLRDTIFFVVIIFLPFLLFSQSSNTQVTDPQSEIKYIFYEVTETIRSSFGSTRVKYTVSNKNMINDHDLGPNNTREVKEVIVYKNKKKVSLDSTANTIQVKKDISIVDKKKEVNKTIVIDPLETYERMVEKGVKSIDILKVLGDNYFIKNDFKKAAKYYEDLFNLTKNLKQEYYLRYYRALGGSGQTEKAKEFNEKYNLLVNN